MSSAEFYIIRFNTFQWFAGFLSDRTHKVVEERKDSNTAPVTAEVSQGTVLDPIVFLVCINDMPEHIKHCTVRLCETTKDIDKVNIWENLAHGVQLSYKP